VTQPPESDPGTPPPGAQPPQVPSEVPTEQAPQWPGPEAMQPTTQFSQPVPPEPGPQPDGPPQYGQPPAYPQAPGYNQPPYSPPPGYGPPPTYGQSPAYGQPPGDGPPPGGYPPYGGGYGQPPPNRGNGKIVGIIVAVLAVIALGLGAFLAFGGNNKSDSSQTTNRSSQTASSPSIASSEPSTDTGSPTTDTTTGTGEASQDQKEAAKVIEDFFHRAGARDGTAFCDDADAADVKAVMKDKSIPTCARIEFTSATLRKQMRTMSIEARNVIVAGNVGVAVMYKPVNFWDGPIRVRKNAAGAWKVRLLNT
jgi:hypothetical protein